MFKGLTWIIVIIVLNAVVAALAKKAQANAQAAKQGAVPPASPPQPAQQQGAMTRSNRVVARTGGSNPRAAQATKAPRPPKPPQGRSYVVDSVDDSSDAMQSRRRLLEEVAKVKAAEAKVAQASGIKADHSAMALQVNPKIARLGAAELRKALASPADIRKALILGEVLGRPRGA